MCVRQIISLICALLITFFRLDFVRFQLAPATLTSVISGSYPVYKCSHDMLTIHPNHYNVPNLCGNNDKQHGNYRKKLYACSCVRVLNK